MMLAANETESLRLIERSLGEVRFELAIVKLALALKYSPDQPRVPAGNPDGGQWTSGGEGNSDRDAASGLNERLILAGGFTEEQKLMRVRDFVSDFCKGSANRELPGQFSNATIKQVMDAARAGDAAARKCIKILGRDDYRK